MGTDKPNEEESVETTETTVELKLNVGEMLDIVSADVNGEKWTSKQIQNRFNKFIRKANGRPEEGDDLVEVKVDSLLKHTAEFIQQELGEITETLKTDESMESDLSQLLAANIVLHKITSMMQETYGAGAAEYGRRAKGAFDGSER